MGAISVEHVYKVFGKHPERALDALRAGEDRDAVYEETGQFCAVNDVSFTVDPGDLFVIMGLSGSGKSTLVRMINRLHDPTAGTVYIGDEDISTLNSKALRDLRARKISMVFQTFALFPHRSVLDNAAYGLEVQRVDRDERRERAAKALEMVGLSGWEDRMPKQLSGGMRQRVGLARALATEADIMLMDEPFSALDPLIRRDMQAQLIELQQELQRTIVFITHDLNEAMRLGDRVAVMKAGVIVQNDTPEAILHKPADDYVAEFIQDVDRSRILTASAVMRDPVAVLSPRHGPKVALRELEEHQRNELYVVDQQRLVGAVRDRELAEAASRGDSTIEGCVHDDYPRAAPDTPIAELLQPAAKYEIPVAVVEEDRLVGVVPRALLLGALGSPEEASGA
ncbi:MAG TPA: glycine betaine/L-proline ABC transporter ATP-binding protein [Egibacteraceae bacterium]|nr:glycine betaine/L-proline ABC transporter ATP-binding protein [Egibacteraceae bacterium]